MKKIASALTSKARNKLSDSAFVFPAERRYPIHDEAHARNALARASGKPEEGKVRAAVHAKFPNIGKEKQAEKMMKVPNPASAKGASRTRDSFRQPMVGDDADWSQRTNLTSVQGNSGRVMPAASQMNKAASSKEQTMESQKRASANTALGGKYPLDSYADIKSAVDYFGTNWADFDPVERHIFCVKTAAAARSIGLEVPEMMSRYGSLEYAPDITAHIASRKASLEKNAHGMYDALMEKKAELHPEEFADLLTKADIATGLNWHWGGPVADPYFATFGGQPKEQFFKVASGEISESQLQAIADSGALDGLFEKDLVEGFKKDPATIFASLPDDTKQVIANLAG